MDAVGRSLSFDPPRIPLKKGDFEEDFGSPNPCGDFDALVPGLFHSQENQNFVGVVDGAGRPFPV